MGHDEMMPFDAKAFGAKLRRRDHNPSAFWCLCARRCRLTATTAIADISKNSICAVAPPGQYINSQLRVLVVYCTL
jgi:hypothetical protein